MKSGSLVLQIARPLLPSFPPLEHGQREDALRELDRFLAAQLAAMPRYLALPFSAALLAFNWLPLLRYGRTYLGLPQETQLRVVLAWSDSRLGAMRNFIKLVRTCALFAWLDHPLLAAHLEPAAEEPALETGTCGAD